MPSLSDIAPGTELDTITGSLLKPQVPPPIQYSPTAPIVAYDAAPGTKPSGLMPLSRAVPDIQQQGPTPEQQAQENSRALQVKPAASYGLQEQEEALRKRREDALLKIREAKLRERQADAIAAGTARVAVNPAAAAQAQQQARQAQVSGFSADTYNRSWRAASQGYNPQVEEMRFKLYVGTGTESQAKAARGQGGSHFAASTSRSNRLSAYLDPGAVAGTFENINNLLGIGGRDQARFTPMKESVWDAITPRLQMDATGQEILAARNQAMIDFDNEMQGKNFESRADVEAFVDNSDPIIRDWAAKHAQQYVSTGFGRVSPSLTLEAKFRTAELQAQQTTGTMSKEEQEAAALRLNYHNSGLASEGVRFEDYEAARALSVEERKTTFERIKRRDQINKAVLTGGFDALRSATPEERDAMLSRAAPWVTSYMNDEPMNTVTLSEYVDSSSKYPFVEGQMVVTNQAGDTEDLVAEVVRNYITDPAQSVADVIDGVLADNVEGLNKTEYERYFTEVYGGFNSDMNTRLDAEEQSLKESVAAPLYALANRVSGNTDHESTVDELVGYGLSITSLESEVNTASVKRVIATKAFLQRVNQGEFGTDRELSGMGEILSGYMDAYINSPNSGIIPEPIREWLNDEYAHISAVAEDSFNDYVKQQEALQGAEVARVQKEAQERQIQEDIVTSQYRRALQRLSPGTVDPQTGDIIDPVTEQTWSYGPIPTGIVPLVPNAPVQPFGSLVANEPTLELVRQWNELPKEYKDSGTDILKRTTAGSGIIGIDPVAMKQQQLYRMDMMVDDPNQTFGTLAKSFTMEYWRTPPQHKLRLAFYTQNDEEWNEVAFHGDPTALTVYKNILVKASDPKWDNIASLNMNGFAIFGNREYVDPNGAVSTLWESGHKKEAVQLAITTAVEQIEQAHEDNVANYATRLLGNESWRYGKEQIKYQAGQQIARFLAMPYAEDAIEEWATFRSDAVAALQEVLADKKRLGKDLPKGMVQYSGKLPTYAVDASGNQVVLSVEQLTDLLNEMDEQLREGMSERETTPWPWPVPPIQRTAGAGG